MATFVSQKNYSSATPRTKSRVEYILDNLGINLDEIIREYFKSHPDGEKVTLEVFKELGTEKINKLAEKVEKPLSVLKKDIGLAIPILGAEIFTSERFHTYRNTLNRKNSQKKTPVEYRKYVDVENYTPHKVVEPQTIESVFGTVQSSTDGVEFQNEMRREERI